MNDAFRSAADRVFAGYQYMRRGILIWKSVTIRRTILLVLLGIALSSTITLAIYQMIAPRLFMEVELRELSPRARYLANAVAFQARLYGGLSDLTTLTPLFAEGSLADSQPYLLDVDGTVLLPASAQGTALLTSTEKAALQTGSDLASLRTSGPDGNGQHHESGMFLAAVTVTRQGVAEAIVCLLKPVPVVDVVMEALIRTLRISTILSVLLLIPVCALAAVRIVRPIYSVRNLAVRIVSGDTDSRVVVPAAGEMRELVVALNTLGARIVSTQDELVLERSRLLRILNALDEGILSADRRGVVNQINPPMQNAIPIRPGDTLPEEMMREFSEAIRLNEQRSFEMPQGGRIWICTVLPIVEQGEVVGAVVSLRDTTHAIRLEQTRRDYVANVSHELRSPLTALRCLLEPLRDGLITKEDRKSEIYDTLLHETLRLSRLVDDMLELSRLQSGTLALEKMAFDPLILCRQIADMTTPRAIERGLTLARLLPEALPLCMSNPDRIEQVLIALLDNAFKFTPHGGTVTVRAEAMDDYVEISVSDTGVGIPAEDLPQVFDRFYKADKSHTGEGTGLGLAIARELMNRLGETIRAESCPDGGAKFTFTIHYV